MTITKEQLIAWATGLHTTDVEVEIDEEAGFGGGTSSPGRWVAGYGLKISVCEEAPDEAKDGLSVIFGN